GEVFAVVCDHLGMPKELLGRDGRIAWAAAHSAWGQVVEVKGRPTEKGGRPIESPFRLLGQYADEETGLCYTRFRYFDTGVGRWCSPDPLGIDGCVDAYQLEGATTYLVDPYGLSCRKDPGVGRKGANHPDAEKWLRGTHGNAGRVPEPIADAL